MNNIEILVGTDRLPLDTKDIGSVAIVKRLKDISDYTKSAASYSKPITVLQTLRTKEVFGTLFNINTTLGFDVTVKQPVLLKENGIALLSGYLKLIKITRKAYSVIIYSSVSTVTSELGNKLIKGNAVSSDDISIANYTQEMSVTSVVTSMQNQLDGSGTGIRLGYMGIENSARVLPMTPKYNYPIIPSTAVREVLEAILLGVGYTMHLSVEIEDSIKSMYMPYNGTYEDFAKPFQFSDYEFTSTALSSQPQLPVKALLNSINQIRDDLNNESSNAFNIPIREEGNYSIEVTLKIKKTNIGSAREALIGIVLDNTPLIPGFTNTNIDFGDTEVVFYNAEYTTVTFTSKEFRVNNGDSKIFLGFNNVYVGGNVSDLISIDITASKVLLTKSNAWYRGQIITANDVLPQRYKKAELFGDILKMYNAQVIFDGSDIYIDSYNDFYNKAPTFKDWSDKMDIESFELEPLVNIVGASFRFKMGESGDRLSSGYKESESIGINDLTITGHSDVSGSTKEDYSIVAANNPVVNSDDDSISVINLMTGDAVEGVIANYKTDYPARIAIIDSTYHEQVFGVNGGTLTRLKYYTDKINRGTDSDLILSFNSAHTFRGNVTESNRTLYNRFYKTDIESLTGGKYRLTADFKLRAQDASIEFTDKIFITDSEVGSAYFKLNQLKNYSTDESKLVKTELTQVDKTFKEAVFSDTISSIGV